MVCSPGQTLQVGRVRRRDVRRKGETGVGREGKVRKIKGEREAGEEGRWGEGTGVRENIIIKDKEEHTLNIASTYSVYNINVPVCIHTNIYPWKCHDCMV